MAAQHKGAKRMKADRRRFIRHVGAGAVSLALPAKWALAAPKPWLVYYSDKAKITDFRDYGLLVLDSEYHPPLPPLSDRGKELLGYISLGEVEKYRPYYESVRADGIVLQENKYWKGSYFVDVRDDRWVSRVIEELVPGVLRKGFDGLFFDTLDNPPHLERVDPKAFKGMTAASARLVRTIRRHYPHIKIMLNRAYELLPHVADAIDYELGESVFADYDFDNKKYKRVDVQEYRRQVALLKDFQGRHKDLRVMTLD